MTDYSDEQGLIIAQPDPVIHDFKIFPLSTNMPVEAYRVFTSYDLTDGEQGGRFYDLETVGGDNPQDFINLEVEMEHLTVRPIEFVRAENGEIVKTWSVGIGIKGGKILHFKSSGILTSLVALMMVKGRPPWVPAIKMKLVRKATSKEKSRYVLERVGSWATVKPPKK